MKQRIEQLIEELEKEAKDNLSISQNGSPVTSLNEDITLGEVGREQKRIASILREIIS